MTPAVVGTATALRARIAVARREGKTIGFVPTMGALHEGHATLLRRARAEAGFVVISIFVNPTQFGPHEDLARYPRPLAADLALCAAEGVDLAFVPEVEVLYPPGSCTFVEVTGLQDLLEGASRPGHFRGVATVVLKLFNLVQPDYAWFGQKDAQQVRIVQQMVHDLDVPVEVFVEPTVRDADGLALSSRNQYLDATQRAAAPILAQALHEAVTRIRAGERHADAILHLLRTRIAGVAGAELDYAAVVDEQSLQPIDGLEGRVLLLLAVRFGATRLIDNALVETDVPTIPVNL